MDVYGESGKRAHGTGFVGVSADTEDEVDNLEVYEALVNPQESRSGGNKNNGGMMPPMMMGGAGGGNAAAASSGMGNAAAASNAGAVARGVPAGGVVGAPVSAPVASPGVGAGTTAAGAASGTAGLGGGAGIGAAPGGGIGAGAGLPTGVMAAEAGDSGAALGEPTGPVAAAPSGQPGAPGDADGRVSGHGEMTTKDPSSRVDAGDDGGTGIGTDDIGPDGRVQVTDDVVTVDPVEIDRVAKEWSHLADSMAGLSTNISNLQPAEGDFGMVRVPEPSYGAMTSGLHRMAGGASQEFGQISAGLSATTRSFQEIEAEAQATMRGVVQ